MASRTTMENAVNERRLRPIYDSLDFGNNKKALQEADKVLKKQPGNQCARVLKALALLRLGKDNECQALMEKVREEVPCDDSTLQAMTICYREIHQPEKISELYEAAAKANPYNEELLTHLFMSYVRLGDFKKQQHAAMNLYKLIPKNPYYFWAVMSVVMQAIEADEKLAKQVILPLAERMVLKLVKEGKIEAEQEVQLYLMILEREEKYEEMLEVLSGPLSNYLSAVSENKARLLLKLGRFLEAVDAYKNLIDENLDNWTYYLNYITATLECETPSKCLEYLEQKAKVAGPTARAPHLAQLELLKRHEKTSESVNLDTVKHTFEYFEKFGSKGCVVGDLQLYLHLLTNSQRQTLLEKIEELVDVPSDGFPTTKIQMLKHIHLQQLRRISGFHHCPLADFEKREEIVKRLCELYTKGSALCPCEDRLSTDFNPADPYALLAAHVLHQMWRETEDAVYIYKMVQLLERCLLSSPANFNVKIILLRAYLEAGLVSGADFTFSLLDVKHIQIDSLGYMSVSLLAPMGNLSHAAASLDATAKFFITNHKDSADYLTFAYKYGSFLKIQEFVELKKRLELSLHFTTTTIDKMLLELSWSKKSLNLPSILNSMHIEPHEDCMKSKNVRDNRDLEVVIGWEPLSGSPATDPHMRLETFECAKQLLAARILMLRTIGATNELESYTLLSKLSEEMTRLDEKSIPESLRKIDASRENLLVPMDAVTRLREMRNSQQLKVVAKLAKSLARVDFALDADCFEFLRNSPCLKSLTVCEGKSAVSYKNFFLRAATCGETAAFLAIMCITASISRNGAKKKNKKHREIFQGEAENMDWMKISVLLTERLKDLDDMLTKLEKNPVHIGLTDNDETSEMIVENVSRTISQNCKALKSRASNTLALLSSWKS